MIGTQTKTIVDPQEVVKATEKAAFRNFGHAAASISRGAKASIRKSKTPSQPGSPPTTRGIPGKNIRGAIRFARDKEGAVIGPMASLVGTAGEAHEFGGTYKGDEFDERPFMEPALQEAIPRMAGDWKHSIGE